MLFLVYMLQALSFLDGGNVPMIRFIHCN